MDTKFSSAIHTLILIAEAKVPMNSEQIANSVGTNASYIRKLTARLSKAGIIEGRRGISGFILKKNHGEISLLDIYKAVMEVDDVCLFDIHQNPNDACVVGHHILPVLSGMFGSMEKQMEQQLKAMTLNDCIHAMRERRENRKN